MGDMQNISNLKHFTLKIWNKRKKDNLGAVSFKFYLLDKTP